MIYFGIFFSVLFPFCRQDMGKELTASSRDGWMVQLSTSASSCLPTSPPKGCGYNINKAPKPAQRNAVQTKAI